MGAGESTYGVFATSSGSAVPTTLELDTVAVAGKAGGEGATGGTPAQPLVTGNGCAAGSGAGRPAQRGHGRRGATVGDISNRPATRPPTPSKAPAGATGCERNLRLPGASAAC